MNNRVIKVVALGLAMVTMMCAMTGCSISNKSWGDFTYSFERAQVRMMDGSVVEGKVDSWLDFEDGDSIQVRINGKTYLTHISNVVLISE